MRLLVVGKTKVCCAMRLLPALAPTRGCGRCLAGWRWAERLFIYSETHPVDIAIFRYRNAHQNRG